MNEKSENKLFLLKLLFDSNTESEKIGFPTICKFIRKTFNVTQSEMAERLQVTLSAYQRWEYGNREPSARVAANLCLMYLQCLYITQQTPRATEINNLLESLLEQETKKLEKDQQDTLVA